MKGAKILLVDDDERILKSFGTRLRRQGHEVIVAESGPEALEKLKEFTPDLIISDMRMQPMDGVKFLERISGLEADGFFPGKIIFTAFDDGEALEFAKLIESGVLRVEKDHWENDLDVAIARGIELGKSKLSAWKLGRELQHEALEKAKLQTALNMANTLRDAINSPLSSILLIADERGIKTVEAYLANFKQIKTEAKRIESLVDKATTLTKVVTEPYATGTEDENKIVKL
jgi:CheY-like chemotaxis protein